MRLRTLEEGDLSEAQRAAVAEAVAGVRGRIPGPMRAWLHSPTMASRAQNLGGFLRYGTSLRPALSELAILLTARHLSCSYVWNAHLAEALKGGLAREVIDGIGRGAAPSFARDDEGVVYDYATTLLATNRVPQALHERAVAAFGEASVVELVGVIGYYSLVAHTVNAFAFPLQPGAQPIFGEPAVEQG